MTGSSPVNGSSMSRTSGSCRIAAMNWTFCWLPLLTAPRRGGRRSSGIRKRSSHSVRVRAGRGRAARRTARRSRRAGRGRPSAGRARAPRAGSPTSAAAGRRVGDPSQRTSPASARRIPRQIRIVVVLPAPLAPRKPKISPRGTSNVSSSSATVVPNRFVTWSMSRLTRRRIAPIGHAPRRWADGPGRRPLPRPAVRQSAP